MNTRKINYQTSNISTRVRSVMAAHFAVSDDKITPETRMIEDLGADSLDMAELLLLLEEEFDTKIPEAELLDLSTVSDVVVLGERLLLQEAA
jgi:acyl carrier protein